MRLTAVALTFALTFVKLIAFALVMARPTAAAYAAEWLALGPQFPWAWNIVRWPLAFALVAAAIECIYHFAPDTTHEGVWVTPGVTAATLWRVPLHFAGSPRVEVEKGAALCRATPAQRDDASGGQQHRQHDKRPF